MLKGTEKSRTICWDCAKACGKCSWSEYGRWEPVPGWKAERTELRVNAGNFIESYTVIECPEFMPDLPAYSKN